MNYLVYKITNIINGKLYFGITKYNLQKRWNEHKHNALKEKTKSYLHLAIKKYGANSFTIELVKSCNKEHEMYNLEKKLISKHKSQNSKYGYNNSSGGEISSAGKTVSKLTRDKISKTQTGRKRKPHTEITKQNMSKAAKGRDMTKVIKRSAELRRGKPAFNVKMVILDNKEVYSSIKEAANKYGVSPTSISNNLNGRSKKTKLGKWEYVQKKSE